MKQDYGSSTTRPPGDGRVGDDKTEALPVLDFSQIEPDARVTDAILEKVTGIRKRTWESYRYRGCGPPFVVIGRLITYTWRDVVTWWEARKVTSSGAGRALNRRLPKSRSKFAVNPNKKEG